LTAPDFYGGHLGDNLTPSLLCLDVKTGRRVWSFQTVHHGLWDYDNPAAPNLLDITVDGRRIEAVAQVTKQGFVYTFDRVTGEPVWPIVERPVPASDVPGERASTTQPFPTKPAPFEYQGVTADDLADFTPAIREQAVAAIRNFRTGPLFTPPSLVGTIVRPGRWAVRTGAAPPWTPDGMLMSRPASA
jgi:quinoprotein glucose dehydrogenase